MSLTQQLEIAAVNALPEHDVSIITPRPTDLPTPPAEIVQNQPYIELPTDCDVVAVRSDVGTGKTKSMIRALQSAKGALYLVPRVRLAENFCTEAAEMGVKVGNYKLLSSDDCRRVSHSAFCVNSYSALADGAQGLLVPEVLGLDEFEQVLDHIYGEAGTFTDTQAIETAEALRFVIRRSPRVLAMDAHLSDLGLDYLREQGRDVTRVVNNYVTPRGPLTLHTKREAAIARGELLVSADEGTVVFAVAKAKEAAVIETRLVELLGNSAAVLLLTAENSGGERQSAFFADPNGQIGQYRAVIYSPVIGTGFDITTTVRAVIGVMADHLSAYDDRQMIGRCRNTQETHVYLPKTSGKLEESAAVIEAEALEEVGRRIKRLNADGVRVPAEIDEAQRHYLHWHARVMARRNWSINHLREHFISLSEGYTISSSEHDDPELLARLKAIREKHEARRKAQVLTVTPVDADTFRQLSAAGNADERVVVGRLRDEIESMVGAPISPVLRDALWTPEQRQSLCRFTDLIDDIGELKALDALDVVEGVLPTRRRHRVKCRNVVNAFLHALITEDGELLRLNRNDLESAAGPVVKRYDRDLRRLFDWRPDRNKSAARPLERVLKTVGLTLRSEQRTIKGKHVRVYRLDPGTWEPMWNLGQQRCAMLRRQRADEQEEPPILKLPSA